MYKPVFMRFWEKVLLDDDDKCWEYIGPITSGGYGKITNKGKGFPAHRFSWMIRYGKIPNGLCVLHKCDNPPCVNPKHLFLGTYKDNAQDKIKKHRCNFKGTNNGRAKLDWNKVNKIRELWITGNYTKVGLGKLFGVSDTTIGMIIKNQIWGDENAYSVV